ncbi:MAG: phosphonate ABC transporter, permease protein PhnE [Candidatus Bipolaricaulota bacterium]
MKKPKRFISPDLPRQLKSLFLDWLVWGYLAYTVIFLLDSYWYTQYVDWYGSITLEPWGWGLTFLGTFLCALASRKFGISIGSKTISGEERSPKRSWALTNWGITSIVLVLFTFWVGWLTTDMEIGVIARRAPKTFHLWHGLSHPDFTHLINIDPELEHTILGSLVDTLFMAYLATVIGGLLAAPLGFLGARNIMGGSWFRKAIFYTTRAFFNVIRSVESLLWAIVFAIWIGWGPAAGSFALLIHSMAALAKLFSEQVESIKKGPIEAIQSTGASFWQIIRYGAVPQVVPQYTAFLLYRLDINVRMATVIALVGGGGIGRFFFYYKSQLDWNQVGAVTIVIASVVWILDYISGKAREKIV